VKPLYNKFTRNLSGDIFRDFNHRHEHRDILVVLKSAKRYLFAIQNPYTRQLLDYEFRIEAIFLFHRQLLFLLVANVRHHQAA
jgi:hypothetical protein